MELIGYIAVVISVIVTLIHLSKNSKIYRSNYYKTLIGGMIGRNAVLLGKMILIHSSVGTIASACAFALVSMLVNATLCGYDQHTRQSQKAWSIIPGFWENRKIADNKFLQFLILVGLDSILCFLVILMPAMYE